MKCEPFGKVASEFGKKNRKKLIPTWVLVKDQVKRRHNKEKSRELRRTDRLCDDAANVCGSRGPRKKEPQSWEKKEREKGK